MNRAVRIRGVLLVVLGLALAIGMAWLIGQLGPIMQPGGSPSGARFTGTAEQAWWINALLTGILALGAAFALYGLFMAITGRESRIVRAAASLLWVGMLGASLVLSGAGRTITNIF